MTWPTWPDWGSATRPLVATRTRPLRFYHGRDPMTRGNQVWCVWPAPGQVASLTWHWLRACCRTAPETCQRKKHQLDNSSINVTSIKARQLRNLSGPGRHANRWKGPRNGVACCRTTRGSGAVACSQTRERSTQPRLCKSAHSLLRSKFALAQKCARRGKASRTRNAESTRQQRTVVTKK